MQMPSVSPLTSPKQTDGWPQPETVSNNRKSEERPFFQIDTVEPNVDNNAMFSSIMNQDNPAINDSDIINSGTVSENDEFEDGEMTRIVDKI